MRSTQAGRFAMAALAAAVGLVLAAGCSQGRGEAAVGPFPTRVSTPATAPLMGTPDGAAADDVNPVRPVGPASAPPGPARPEATLTRPDRPAEYEARLDDVATPTPLLTEPSGKNGDQVYLVNAVLAQVNDEVITREDILGPLRTQVEQWRTELSPEAFEGRYRYVVQRKLREAINQRLAVQEAKRVLKDEEKKEIEAALEKLLKDLTAEAGSRPLLEARLARQGTTVDAAMERERQRMLVQRFLQQRIAPSVHVTHSELLSRYEEVRAERYVKPTRVRLGLMTLKKNEFLSAEEGRALAAAVHKRAEAGEDFARLAERYSHDVMAAKGGDWDFMTQGAFRVKAVDEALFRLSAGQVAPLVETDDAWYVVKTLAREEGRTVPFTEVQGEIEQEIRDERFNDAAAKYIQDLYGRAYVRIVKENQ